MGVLLAQAFAKSMQFRWPQMNMVFCSQKLITAFA